MDINAESVLDALNDFERKPSEIPPILEDYLLRVAQNGEIIFPWCKLKPLLKRKLEIVLDEFYESCPVEISVPVPNFETFNYDSLKKTILTAVEAFSSAPFTIQRICELITNPKKHYNRTDKYMRGIEKNVLVVSTIEPRLGGQSDGNANVNPIVNGMIGDSPHDDNDCFNGHENNENEPPNNLNTPANHVSLDNFANVFPSAACIPSPSSICINQEVDSASSDSELDSNFTPASESADSSEVEFTPQVSMDTTETSESKDDMDTDTTVEEEQSTSFTDICEVPETETEVETQLTSDESEVSQPESEKHEDEVDISKTEEELMSNEVSDTSSAKEGTNSTETVSESAHIKNEAECLVDSGMWFPGEFDNEPVFPQDAATCKAYCDFLLKKARFQPDETTGEAYANFLLKKAQWEQDHTVSQSDETTSDSTGGISQSDVTACNDNEASPDENDNSSANENEDSSTESNTEVSQSIDNEDSSEQVLANQKLRSFRIRVSTDIENVEKSGKTLNLEI